MCSSHIIRTKEKPRSCVSCGVYLLLYHIKSNAQKVSTTTKVRQKQKLNNLFTNQKAHKRSAFIRRPYANFFIFQTSLLFKFEHLFVIITSLESQKRATAKYIKNSCDEIRTRVPKGKKDEIKAYAEKYGYSLNSFVNEALDEKMQKPAPSGTENEDKSE